MLHSSVCGRMEVMELEAMPEESALVKSIGGCLATLSWLSASWWFFTFAFAVTTVAKEISIEVTEDKEMPQLLVQLEMLNRHHQKRIPIVLSDLQDPLKSDAKWDNSLLVRSQGVRFRTSRSWSSYNQTVIPIIIILYFEKNYTFLENYNFACVFLFLSRVKGSLHS